MRVSLALLALLAIVPCPALAASRPAPLEHAGGAADRVDAAAARAFYGRGRSDPALQAGIARALDEGLGVERPSREAIDALVAYVRALGGTGDAAYRPIVERAMASRVRAIARAAREARDDLERSIAHGAPHILPEHVRLVEQVEADGCRYLRTAMCRGGESVDECLDEHRTTVAETGGNALLVLTRVENTGIAQYDTGSMVGKHYRCPVPGYDPNSGAAAAPPPTP